MKLANLAALERIAPAVRRVITWNAHVNAPMLRINAQLGFRADGQTTEWQKMLA